MKKILFIHNTAMWYRIPFFKKLSELYDVKFVFTHIRVCKDVYGVAISNEIEGLDDVDYKTLKNNLNFMKPYGIAFGVIKEAMGEYELIVGGSWDSLAEIIETSFYFTIAKLRRKPFVIWRENWGWKEKSLKRTLITRFAKIIVSQSDAVLVPGSKHMEYLISLGASPEGIFIMPNVSNLLVKKEDHIYKEKIREELNIGTKKVFLYIGRLIKKKGVEYLIEAFAKLRNERADVVLIIIGRGECRDESELLSKNLSLENSVYFMGYVEDELLPAYYLLCDVCVVPSITYGTADPCPLVVNEAMYCGKPVIATDAVGAAFDMIKDGVNGFMVPEKDSDALYEAMRKIITDHELEKRMGEESKRIIEEGFRYDNMIEGFGNAVSYVLRETVK